MATTTGTVLKRSLERMVDDAVDNTDAVDLYNSALKDLSPVARKKTKTLVAFLLTDRSLALPTNILTVEKIRFNFNDGTFFDLSELATEYGVEVYNNETIVWVKDLPNSGSVEVRYTRTLVAMTAITDIPDIEETYIDALNHYAAREIFDNDEEPEQALKHSAKYQAKKAEYDMYTKDKGISKAPALANVRPAWARR